MLCHLWLLFGHGYTLINTHRMLKPLQICVDPFYLCLTWLKSLRCTCLCWWRGLLGKVWIHPVHRYKAILLRKLLSKILLDPWYGVWYILESQPRRGDTSIAMGFSRISHPIPHKFPLKPVQYPWRKPLFNRVKFFHKSMSTFIPWKSSLIPFCIKTVFTEVLS